MLGRGVSRKPPVTGGLVIGKNSMGIQDEVPAIFIRRHSDFIVELGARTDGLTHPLKQVLLVKAGVGRVQWEGGPIEEIHPGDVV